MPTTPNKSCSIQQHHHCVNRRTPSPLSPLPDNTARSHSRHSAPAGNRLRHRPVAPTLHSHSTQLSLEFCNTRKTRFVVQNSFQILPERLRKPFVHIDLRKPSIKNRREFCKQNSQHPLQKYPSEKTPYAPLLTRFKPCTTKAVPTFTESTVQILIIAQHNPTHPAQLIRAKLPMTRVYIRTQMRSYQIKWPISRKKCPIASRNTK